MLVTVKYQKTVCAFMDFFHIWNGIIYVIYGRSFAKGPTVFIKATTFMKNVVIICRNAV